MVVLSSDVVPLLSSEDRLESMTEEIEHLLSKLTTMTKMMKTMKTMKLTKTTETFKTPKKSTTMKQIQQ
jgi:Asp-tRNA(Asn)/Glu-tRNA(Gln) amidotransferase C subunit